MNETVSQYVTKTDNYNNYVLSRLKVNQDPICYVLDYKGNTGFVFGPSGNVYNSSGHVNNQYDCRWIDYVGKVRKANDQTKNNAGTLNNSEEYYRLSFK